MAGTRRRAREVERARYARQQERRALQRAQQHRRQRTTAVVASVVAVVAIVSAIAYFTNRNPSVSADTSSSSSESTSVSDSTSVNASATTSPAASVSSLVGITAAKCAKAAAGKPGSAQYKSAPSLTFPSGAKVTVTLKTTCGDIALSLDAAKAPKTASSIVTLARKGFFDHTICHRLTDDGIYVLQCGDPTGTGSGGPGYTLPDENLPTGKKDSSGQVVYPAGTLAMANTGTAHTGGSQFFLVYQDSPLAPTYTAFGQLTPASLKVVREIAKAGIIGAPGSTDGAPAANVVINSVGVTGAPGAGTS